MKKLQESQRIAENKENTKLEFSRNVKVTFSTILSCCYCPDLKWKLLWINLYLNKCKGIFSKWKLAIKAYLSLEEYINRVCKGTRVFFPCGTRGQIFEKNIKKKI